MKIAFTRHHVGPGARAAVVSLAVLGTAALMGSACAQGPFVPLASKPAVALPLNVAREYSVTIELAKSRIILGEPIVLHYILRPAKTSGDLRNQMIPFDQRAPWLHVRLIDEGGPWCLRWI